MDKCINLVFDPFINSMTRITADEFAVGSRYHITHTRNHASCDVIRVLYNAEIICNGNDHLTLQVCRATFQHTYVNRIEYQLALNDINSCNSLNNEYISVEIIHTDATSNTFVMSVTYHVPLTTIIQLTEITEYTKII